MADEKPVKGKRCLCLFAWQKFKGYESPYAGDCVGRRSCELL